MYEVKPYKGDEDNLFYGIYIKSTYNGYKEDYQGNDNLVVLCHDVAIANKIVRLLNMDNKLFENDGNL